LHACVGLPLGTRELEGPYGQHPDKRVNPGAWADVRAHTDARAPPPDSLGDGSIRRRAGA